MDTTTGSGVSGFLHGFVNTFGPMYIQKQQQEAATNASLQVAQFKAAQKHFTDLPDAQQKELMADPEFQKGFFAPLSKGNLPKPEFVAKILTVRNPLTESGRELAQREIDKQLGKSSGFNLIAPAVAPGANLDVPGSAGNQAATAAAPQPTPAAPVAPAEPSAPRSGFVAAGYPGSEIPYGTVQGAGVGDSTPARVANAPATLPPAEDEKRVDINLKVPGVGTMTLKDLSVSDKEKMQVRRAFTSFQKGASPEEAFGNLSPTGLVAVGKGLQQLSEMEINRLTSQDVPLEGAIHAAIQKYGVGSLPDRFAKLVDAESLAAAGARGRFPYQAGLARLQSNLRVDTAEPQAAGAARGRLGVEAELKPDMRQQAGKILNFDMTQPLTPEQELQVAGAQRVLEGQKAEATGAGTARGKEIVSPSPATVAARAANVPEGPLTTEGAQSIEQRKIDQAKELATSKAAAKVSAGLNAPISVKDRPNIIDRKTELPVAAGKTYRQSNADNDIALRPQDVGTYHQLKSVDKFFEVYENLAKKVFVSDNPAVNWKRFKTLEVKADPDITMLKALAPEFTGYIRLKGERGQSTEGDITRGFRGLAYGEGIAGGYVRREGVLGAINNARVFTDETRKALGFDSKLAPQSTEPLQSGAKLDLGDGYTAEVH